MALRVVTGFVVFHGFSWKHDYLQMANCKEALIVLDVGGGKCFSGNLFPLMCFLILGFVGNKE